MTQNIGEAIAELREAIAEAIRFMAGESSHRSSTITFAKATVQLAGKLERAEAVCVELAAKPLETSTNSALWDALDTWEKG